MKNKIVFTICTTLLTICISICLLILFPGMSTLNASSNASISDINYLIEKQNQLTSKIESVVVSLDSTVESVDILSSRILDIENDLYMVKTELVSYYITKLPDKSYTDVYGDGYTWYTCAEYLGSLGKPAIRPLIERLELSRDPYEISLIFYSLLLSSQDPKVLELTDDNYIHTELNFDTNTHDSQRKIVSDWWEKYGHLF